MKLMSAEILFLDPGDVKAAIAELTAYGFQVEVLPWKDECGPTVFLTARLMTELDQDSFYDLVYPIVDSYSSGDVTEWGQDDPLYLLRGA